MSRALAFLRGAIAGGLFGLAAWWLWRAVRDERPPAVVRSPGRPEAPELASLSEIGSPEWLRALRFQRPLPFDQADELARALADPDYRGVVTAPRSA